MKKIFISSTFKDMQYERDILHEQVLPELNRMAMDYGDALSLCDLRWGVDTGDMDEAQAARKVLSVCLDEIDRCRPYMIVIVGARYGWIPDRETREDLLRNRLEGLRDLERSVTEMEIEYGALSRKMDGRCLFYFRNADYSSFPDIYRCEDEKHRELLEQLKQRIRACASDGVLREYTISWNREKEAPDGLDEFADLVRQDLVGLMREEWKHRLQLSPWEKESVLQWNLAEERAEQFAAREALIRGVCDRLDHGTHLVIVRGESGSGKSMLLSRLAVSLREEGQTVLPFFCGSSVFSGSAGGLMGCMIRMLEEILPGENAHAEDQEDLQERLSAVIDRCRKELSETVTILIDAVDQLTPDRNRDQFRFIPGNLSEKVRFVVSMLNHFPVPAGIRTDMIQMGGLSEAERQEVIRGILGFQGKELDASVTARIAAKKSAGNPLYLRILVQRLLMMDRDDFAEITARGDGQEAIRSYEMKLIDEMPDSLQSAAISVIDHALEKSGQMTVRVAAAFISMSRFGLRVDDLRGLSGMVKASGFVFRELDFSMFTGYLRGFFVVREDGRYDFSHRVLKEGMYRHWKYPERLHNSLAYYLRGLDGRDEIRRSELIWHCFGARDRDAFFSCMRGGQEAEMKAAAATLLDCCARDGDGWITDQIRSLIILPGRQVREILYFLLEVFPKEIRGTEDGLMIERKVLQAVLDVIRSQKEVLNLIYEEDRGEAAEWEDFHILTLCLLGEVSGRLGRMYAAETRQYLEEAAAICSEERLGEMLKDGMKRDRVYRLLAAFRSLSRIYTEEGRFEEAVAMLNRCRPLNWAVCGRFRCDLHRFGRVGQADAFRHYAEYYAALARNRFRFGPEGRRSALNSLEAQLFSYRDIPEEERGACEQSRMLLLEVKAELYAQMDEPLFRKMASDISRTVLAFREKAAAEEPGAEQLAALSRSCFLAGSAALRSDDPDERAECLEFLTRAVRIEQQRSVLLGTEDSLLALIAAYKRLEEYYATLGDYSSDKMAAQISGLCVRLSEAAWSRWSSDEAYRNWFLCIEDASRRYIGLGTGEMEDIGHGYAKRCLNRRKTEEDQSFYRVRERMLWAEIARVFGGEKNLGIALNSLMKAKETAEEAIEKGHPEIGKPELALLLRRIAGVLSLREKTAPGQMPPAAGGSPDAAPGAWDYLQRALRIYEEETAPGGGHRGEYADCLVEAAAYLAARGDAGASAYFTKAEAACRSLSANSEEVKNWERLCRILTERTEWIIRSGGEEDKRQLPVLFAEQAAAARRLYKMEPGARNMIRIADVYGRQAQAAGQEFSECLDFAGKACERHPGWTSAKGYFRWAFEAAGRYLDGSDPMRWDVAYGLLQDAFSRMMDAAKTLPEVLDDLEKFRSRVFERAAVYANEEEPALRGRHAMCNAICGLALLQKAEIGRLRRNLAEDEPDGATADLIYKAGTWFWAAERSDTPKYRLVTKYAASRVMSAARALIGKDPSPENRKRFIRGAALYSRLLGVVIREFNEAILEDLLEAEPHVEALLSENDPEAAELAAEIYGDIHQTYFYLNPVKYAGKILEYRRKQKRYKK